MRAVEDIETEAGIRLLVQRADRRDQHAEQRDRRSESRDTAARARWTDTNDARDDRSGAAVDRFHSGDDRDEAAADRADLLEVYRRSRRPAPPAEPQSDAEGEFGTIDE